MSKPNFLYKGCTLTLCTPQAQFLFQNKIKQKKKKVDTLELFHLVSIPFFVRKKANFYGAKLFRSIKFGSHIKEPHEGHTVLKNYYYTIVSGLVYYINYLYNLAMRWSARIQNGSYLEYSARIRCRNYQPKNTPDDTKLVHFKNSQPASITDIPNKKYSLRSFILFIFSVRIACHIYILFTLRSFNLIIYGL